ncbi:phospholipase D family nuclease [Variovorax jilinensis]|uniref:phospholipase D family nuclease n=1 Tax=Variovorax jilinensis TaxID=3053513 RepID=UPI00403830F3
MATFAGFWSCVAPSTNARGLPPAGPAAQARSNPPIEVAFSPEAGAEALVIKVIRSAHSSVRLAAYSFTSPTVVRALVDAKQRGVDVAVLVDHKSNVQETRSSASRAALNLLVNAGIPTRTVSAYAIHHDKFIVADGLHVETGSFNFTASAAKRNSENVLVAWNNPALAKQYLAHWQSRWALAIEYRSSY